MEKNDLPLSLPQAEICFRPDLEYGREVFSGCVLLVLGGRAPSPSWLSQAAYGRTVWAADRGADACMVAGVVPRYVLGDFDSISKEGEAWLKEQGVITERFPADKDFTDFQLCLSRTKGDLLVTGCWGGRFDHAFANVFSALWGYEHGARVLAFADDLEILVPLTAGNGAVEICLLSDTSAVSLLPLCEVCEGVSVCGTKWELSGARLGQGYPYAVSNVPEKTAFSVEVGKGILGVYCFFGEP